ncbi:MAG: hypothetical protein ABII13_01600 [Patescibacteria group bacterium]|nr:hypothetical protein [Patescibacteria group bacterium]MBU2509544.1 hypothetical protein [Patescibacteria group bacterium]
MAQEHVKIFEGTPDAVERSIQKWFDEKGSFVRRTCAVQSPIEDTNGGVSNICVTLFYIKLDVAQKVSKGCKKKAKR